MDLTLLENINSEEDLRQKIRDEIIKYVNNDGVKVVDPQYVEYIKNIDTFKLGHDLSPFNEKESLKHTLFSMQLQTYIKEEIAALTGDLSASSTPLKFLEEFKKLGFELIYQRSIDVERNLNFKNEKEYLNFITSHKGFIENNSSKDEIALGEFNYTSTNFEYILFNKDNSFLIHLDTFDGSVNQARLLGMIENINPDYSPINARIFRRDTYSSHYTIDMDLLELPIDSYWQLISNSKPVKEWPTFLIYFDSCLDEHENIDSISKLKKFPVHVLNKIVFNQIDFKSEIKAKNQKIEMYKDFFMELPEDIIKDYVLRAILFQKSIYANTRDFLFNNDLLAIAKNKNMDIKELTIYHSNIEYNEHFKKCVNDLFFDNPNSFLKILKSIDTELFKFVDINYIKQKLNDKKAIELVDVIENMKTLYDKQSTFVTTKKNKITLN